MDLNPSFSKHSSMICSQILSYKRKGLPHFQLNSIILVTSSSRFPPSYIIQEIRSDYWRFQCDSSIWPDGDSLKIPLGENFSPYLCVRHANLRNIEKKWNERKEEKKNVLNARMTSRKKTKIILLVFSFFLRRKLVSKISFSFSGREIIADFFLCYIEKIWVL